MSLRNAHLVLLLSGAVGVVSLSVAQGPKLNGDLPAGSMQQKATAACLECHETRIILQQRLSKAAWTKEVDKMTKWGALVDANDRDALIDYLSSNFGPEQAAYIAPLTQAEKTAAKGSTQKPPR